MCVNSAKGRFMVDGIGKFYLNCTSKKDILFCLSFSMVNDILACELFRKFWNAS